MYKKGVRSMPRCFKKELVKLYPEAFSSIDAVKPLVGPDFTIRDEDRIVDLLTQILGLPSFWLVTSTHQHYTGSFWLIFESKLNINTEKQLRVLEDAHRELFILNYSSSSEYYGIY